MPASSRAAIEYGGVTWHRSKQKPSVHFHGRSGADQKNRRGSKKTSGARTIRFQSKEIVMKDYGQWSCYRAPTSCSYVTDSEPQRRTTLVLAVITCLHTIADGTKTLALDRIENPAFGTKSPFPAKMHCIQWMTQIPLRQIC
jgi:hypothetical protein